MRKVYKMEELDCANCAAKMEDDIKKLDGVNAVSVNFMRQKMTLDADDARFEGILDQAERICKKYEPDCEIIR